MRRSEDFLPPCSWPVQPGPIRIADLEDCARTIAARLGFEPGALEFLSLSIILDKGFQPYPQTPRNARPFARMGVDGVHWSLLDLPGMEEFDMPVVQTCPMDGFYEPPNLIAGRNLRDFLELMLIQTAEYRIGTDEQQAMKEAERNLLIAYFGLHVERADLSAWSARLEADFYRLLDLPDQFPHHRR